MRTHAIKCGSFVAVIEGNPTQDRISELEAQVAKLTAMLEDKVDDTLASSYRDKELKILASTEYTCRGIYDALCNLAEDDDYVPCAETVKFIGMHQVSIESGIPFFNSNPTMCEGCCA